ncbi:MAG: alanine racemase [Thermodesulfobacteriota bacterium]
MTDRPTVAIINIENLKYNYARLKELLGEGTTVMSVIKADAYGHGVTRVAGALEESGCRSFGVALASEGVALREAGIKGEIVVLTGIYPGDVDRVFDFNLTPVVFDTNVARLINERAESLGVKKLVHVKIDTGMGRLGVKTSNVTEFFTEIKNFSRLEIEGVMSHFADAEAEDKAFSKTQLDAFKKALVELEALGINPHVRHIANSAAIIDIPEAHLDMVRAGLMLYGVYPLEILRSKIDLKPVMELKSAVTHIKKLSVGDSVGYGRTFTAERESKVGIVPIGYADGYLRSLSNCGEMLVGGERVKVVGVVSMDTTVVDLTGISDVSAGDEVMIIGRQGSGEITAAEVAEKAGTISYEILCRLGSRVPKIYV